MSLIINYTTYKCAIVLISFYISNLTKQNYFICGQEISSNLESVKQISVNTTPTPNNVLIADKPRYDENIASKFYIQPNIIIRTGESRALGAKYLNETRLLSNQECLTWCLETPSCNTAVYEEKNMQSCYMFDCGSPAKPLCKFTAHNFFTSSVLKMSQHSYELSQWGRQVQQERINLEHRSDVSSTTPLSSDVVMTSSVLPTTTKQPAKKGSNCHHYQFQCINSSECIAIYNVCDGIPQCPDGSDESPELKCPNKDTIKEVSSSKNMPLKNPKSPPSQEDRTPVLKQEPSSALPSAAFTGLQSAPSYKKPPEPKERQHKDYKGMWTTSHSGSPLPKTGYRHHDSDGLGSPFIHKHSQFISANDPHVQSLNQWASDYDQYSPHSTSMEQQYIPYERMEDQYLSNQMSPDYDTGKNFAGYRQDDIPYWPNQDILPDNSYPLDEFPQPRMQNLNKGIGYPDKENVYVQSADQYPESKLNMHIKPPLNQNQQPDIDDYKLGRYPHSSSRQQQRYLALENSLQQRYPNYAEMKAKGYNTLQNDNDPLYNNDDLIKASIVKQMPKNRDQIQLSREHSLKQLNKISVEQNMLHPFSKEMPVSESTEASKDNSLIIVKPTAPSKSIQKTVLDFKMSVAELYQSSSTHTHEANSAILALVIGVTISFFLIILLACRMKTLRRRMSRKGRALAHDADYLVNGMYL